MQVTLRRWQPRLQHRQAALQEPQSGLRFWCVTPPLSGSDVDTQQLTGNSQVVHKCPKKLRKMVVGGCAEAAAVA